PAPRGRPGDFAQAMMDLGATLCRPTKPDCPACPLKSGCLAEKTGAAGAYPVKVPKKPRPVRHGMVFWAVRGDGAVLLRQRPEKGLLGGMMEIPSTEWRGKAWTAREAAASAPVQGKWRLLDGVVRHTFTHFHLELTVLAGVVNGQEAGEGQWSPPSEFSDHALPTVMKKVAKHVASYSS
ncbi:MAG: NUDIX domain-containing protein, partial [Rhodospirillales bacterium]